MNKSQAYKNLVARAKNQYRVYRNDIKPSDADKQRTREFAAKFADKQTFWDALKAKGLTWTQTSNDKTTDMWARNALSKAIACGFDPNSEVNLFAPVVDGVNICNEINLYTYWQGFGYAENTPPIKYLLVAQDWGNLVRCPASFKNDVRDMNAGNKNFIPPTLDGMNLRLFELFKILGRDITKPCEDVFFTNFCLGYRLGNEGGNMTKKLMRHDADLFRELCEILQPENILCLGRITSEIVCETLGGREFTKIFNAVKNYNDFLDDAPQITVPCGGKISRIHPLAHCGGMGTANRSLDRQRADWQRIADEKRLDETIETFRRTNSPEDKTRVLDEIFSRLDDRFIVALNEPPTQFDEGLPIFRNMKSVFVHRKSTDEYFLAAFTNLLEFVKFNEATGRKCNFMFVPVQKLLVDCMNDGGDIILNPDSEHQFLLTRDTVENLLSK